MSRRFNTMALAIMAMAAASNSEPPYYVPPKRRAEHRTKANPGAAINEYESRFHDFVIHGEVIRATSKKAAKKIYEKRHKNK